MARAPRRVELGDGVDSPAARHPQVHQDDVGVEARRPAPRASTPSDASPRTSKPGAELEHAAQTVPYDGVVVDDQQGDQRLAQRHGGPTVRERRRPCRARAPTPPSTVPAMRSARARMPSRPKPPAPVRGGRASGVEAAAVVAYVQGDLVAHVGEGDADAGRPRRAGRRWTGPPGRCAAGWRATSSWSGSTVPVTVNSARTPVRSRPFGDGLLQRLGQAVVLQRRRARGCARSGGPRRGCGGRGRRRGRGGRGPRRGRRCVRDDLELGDDAGQALGDGVVDLGGQPPPLVGDPGLPCLDEELGVQGGVLVEGLLQRGVGAFELGDGLGRARGRARASCCGEMGDDQLQSRSWRPGAPAKTHPLDRAARRQPARPAEPAMVTALREQPEPLRHRARDQLVGVQVADGGVEREERVEPGEGEGDRPSGRT